MDGRGAMLLVALFLLIGSIDGRLTASQQDEILQYHNEVRSNVSPKAKNMRKLKWDNGLARLAQGWASTCPNCHNPRRVHEDFPYVGENIAFSRMDNIQAITKHWYKEEDAYTFRTNTCTPVPGISKCSDYIQMACADTEYVGCGYKKGCQGGYYNVLVCNYGMGCNINNMPYSRQRGDDCVCPPGYKCDGGLCEKA